MKLPEVGDDFIMPFGQFKGQKIGEVPAYYLLWLFNEEKALGKVRLYILQNKALLEKEAETPKHTPNSSFRDHEFK